eukprot:NODE_1125_length_1234_cov_341.837998.p1 GENE.NODE_1125_length_1234_cov_341.837998~~NODE_1125_length_1234_cov_341.837998.p1  ORF type:complete len:360 (-),score=174.59 NODE_1125_length_1234_cov_341.837998:136-1116(-)
MTRTYSFLQLSAGIVEEFVTSRRTQAASVLRRASAKAGGSPELSMLANSVELDAFARVKEAIDTMIAQLKTQQDDETTKNDYCKQALHEIEIGTTRMQNGKTDLESRLTEVQSALQQIESDTEELKAKIVSLQTNMERASEDRVGESQQYQRAVADQIVVQKVLKMALKRLATFYDGKALLQQQQAPTPPPTSYKPNAGARGVMQMMEKLILEAQELVAAAKKGENEAQNAYVTFVHDTNAAVDAAMKEIFGRSQDKARARKAHTQLSADVSDATKELEVLAARSTATHTECDYLVNNFEARHSGRLQEIEALQQAKQVLSGASLS